MDLVVENGTSTISWKYLFSDLADPRTSKWPLMRDPVPMLSILIAYNYLVQKVGPALMANRKPFRLHRPLIVYNALQVLVSLYLFLQGCRLAWFRDYSWRCQPVDYSETPRALEIATACYVYFLAKLSELLDTVFFVMRKKTNQVSFLHLYHHTVMPIVAWGCVKYLPGGHGTFIGFINSFVHIIMYSYYLLAALGPAARKYLWWKKYVTTIQLTQFCAAFVHSSQVYFHDCGYPRFTMLFTLPNSVFFYFLFRDFYVKAYGPAGKSSSAPSAVEKDEMGEANNNSDAAEESSRTSKAACAAEMRLRTCSPHQKCD